MTPNTSTMIRAIAATGRVTLTELKRQGVLVHAALAEMIMRGIKVRSMFSTVQGDHTYWIGQPSINAQSQRPFGLSLAEREAIESIIGDGKWYTHSQLAALLKCHRERAARLVQGIQSGVLDVRCTIQRRLQNGNHKAYLFEVEEPKV